jgi:hypothetical protein
MSEDDERRARALLEIHYRDLSTLSWGLEDGLQLVQRTTGLVRKHFPDNVAAKQIADSFIELQQSIGDKLGYIATMQARIRNEGLAPPDNG